MNITPEVTIIINAIALILIVAYAAAIIIGLV